MTQKIKKSKIVQLVSYAIILLVAIFGCITEYEAKGIDELSDILVVEGLITDDESYIMLSRSSYLEENEWGGTASRYITDARVYVECMEDETLFSADPINYDFSGPPKYLIKTGKLDADKRYRLRIEVDEYNYDVLKSPFETPQMETFEYHSAYSYPIQTPEIDSVFWIKRNRGEPVMIHVATHSPTNEVMYYRWRFNEDWEIIPEVYRSDYPSKCWGAAVNNNLLVGSAEKTVFGKLTDKIAEFPPSSRRFSSLYRIAVKQNAISKSAYVYYANIKKNVEQTGSIFGTIPSELRGNIVCETDKSRPVIGYVDISTTTQKHRFIRRGQVYEPPRFACFEFSADSIYSMCNCDEIPDYYAESREELLPGEEMMYVIATCVDCTLLGTVQIPDDWINN